MRKSLGHHQHYQRSQRVGANVEGEDPDGVEACVDLGKCLRIGQEIVRLQEESQAREKYKGEIGQSQIRQGLEGEQFEGGHIELVVHLQGEKVCRNKDPGYPGDKTQTFFRLCKSHFHPLHFERLSSLPHGWVWIKWSQM